MSKPTGVIVYRGPSRINGKPIVAVVTWQSSNEKTGNMPQLWILPEPTVYGMPTDASKSCDDDSVCGNCPLRHSLNGACYVTLHHGPRAVADGVVRGIYANATLADLQRIRRSILRRGAYGDPAALPDVVLQWVETGRGSGYTHQWKVDDRLQSQVMASVDSFTEYHEATRQGWRTFRGLRKGERLQPGEILCPAYTRGINCFDCGLCNGKRGVDDRRKNIAIPVHGARANRF